MTVTEHSTDQRPALIDIETFFADPDFSSASISPDGTRIAYLAPHRGRRNVWVRGIDETHVEQAGGEPGHRRGGRSDRSLDVDDDEAYFDENDESDDWSRGEEPEEGEGTIHEFRLSKEDSPVEVANADEDEDE